jgi:hypothetical protein
MSDEAANTDQLVRADDAVYRRRMRTLACLGMPKLYYIYNTVKGEETP